MSVAPFPHRSRGGRAGGGDGPHDPDMETRLRHLEDTLPRLEALLTRMDDRLQKMENDTSEVKGRIAHLLTLGDKVDRLALDVAEVKGRVAHLPSTWVMIGTVLGGQLTLAALLVTTFRLLSPH